MFGSLRLLLAFMVVLSHLPGNGYLVHFGFYAVRGFFVISGFVITAGLQEIYHFDGKRFWTNRLLRLLPPYLVVCLITLSIVTWFPAEAGAYLRSWRPESTAYDTLLNLLVIPLEYSETHFRLVPPYWSVAIELQMYALLFIAGARNERLALATLWFGLVYHLACISSNLDFTARYHAAPSATLSFAAGAVAYFWCKRGALTVTPSAAALAFVMWLANTVAAGSALNDEYAYGPGYYFASFLFVILVAGLAKIEVAPLTRRIDQALGEIAYPVFLVQWLAGFVTALAIGSGEWRGWTLTFASLPLILVMAIALAMLNRRLIEPLRQQWRGAPVQPEKVTLGASDLACQTAAGSVSPGIG
jgi:peptidoglycan/LPS O-acetylase OafA/YrhL